MDTSKFREYFNPNNVNVSIHIIGIGAVGSTIGEQIARLGIAELNIYDDDIVMPHNIHNQMFLPKHIGMPKVDALKEILQEINPLITVNAHNRKVEATEFLSGIVFLAADNIDFVKAFVKNNQYNATIKAMFNGRMRLTDAQMYAATWEDENIKYLLNTMNFTSAEAKQYTPVSACGTELNVVYIVRAIVSFIMANFVKYLNGKPIYKMGTIDLETMNVDAFLEKE